MAIDPRCYLAYILKGVIYLATLDFRNALRAFDNVLALGPDEATRLNIYEYEAMIYSTNTSSWSDTDCSDPKKAIDCCEKMLQIDPQNRTALLLLTVLRGGVRS